MPDHEFLPSESSLRVQAGQTIFGRLELLRPLGRGSFGEVWLARDIALKLNVALKFIFFDLSAERKALTLLRQEAEMLRRLGHHPNIVRVYQPLYDASLQLAAIEMEHLSGGTLREKLQRQTQGFFTIEALSPWIQQLCSALIHVHEYAIHRDLKLDNLMFDEREDIHLMDFSIARRISDARTTRTEYLANNLGTLAYASPEQIRGKKPTIGDDIYALGVILYHLVTGELPFYNRDSEIMRGMILNDPPVSPNEKRRQTNRAYVPLTPENWEKTILSCLAKTSRGRPKTVAEVWKRLHRSESAPQTAAEAFFFGIFGIRPRLPTVDVGLRFGSKYLSLYVAGEGAVLREPALVAVRTGTRQILALGEDVLELERVQGDVKIIRPVKNDAIADPEAVEALLRACFQKVVDKEAGFRVVVTVPFGATELEKQAIRRSVASAGAREVYLIQDSLAVAIGEGLPVQEVSCSAIIRCGSTTTEVAVIAQSSIALARAVKIGGDDFDEAIVQYIKRAYNVSIGEQSAEEVKRKIGSVYPPHKAASMLVTGLDVVAGLPKTLAITPQELWEPLIVPVSSILDTIRATLEQCPPQMSADLTDRGFLLAGGGALLNGLDRLISEETGLPVHLANDPQGALIEGAGRALSVLPRL